MICMSKGLIVQNESRFSSRFRRTELLPPQYYVYYTWIDPFKPNELVVAINEISHNIQLDVSLRMTVEMKPIDSILASMWSF